MAAMSVKSTPSRPRSCPICGKATAHDFRPFCSKACRDRDFLQWADGGYKLPGTALDDDAIEQIEKNATNGVDSGTDD